MSQLNYTALLDEVRADLLAALPSLTAIYYGGPSLVPTAAKLPYAVVRLAGPVTMVFETVQNVEQTYRVEIGVRGSHSAVGSNIEEQRVADANLLIAQLMATGSYSAFYLRLIESVELTPSEGDEEPVYDWKLTFALRRQVAALI